MCNRALFVLRLLPFLVFIVVKNLDYFHDASLVYTQ